MTLMPRINPKLDLVLERVVDVPAELVWTAWTTPEHLREWFCPKPWQVDECEIDLRPGGVFRTLMRGPEGEESPHIGCYLEVVPGQRLVWTSALLPGFRPAPLSDFPVFTAYISLTPEGQGTRYNATVLHRDEQGCQQHAEMGFYEGWGISLDQLVAHVKAMQGR